MERKTLVRVKKEAAVLINGEEKAMLTIAAEAAMKAVALEQRPMGHRHP
jgi:hypothetical protein